MRTNTGRVFLVVAVTSFTFAAARPLPLAAQELPAIRPAAPPAICRLTLEEARHRALANNKALTLARLNADEKQHATAAARKDYFPKLLGSLTYFHFDQDLGSVVTLRTGQRGFLPPGARTVNVAVVNQDAALSTVFVAQPITKLIAVNALVQIARADQNIAQAKLDNGAKALLGGVTQAYYGLLGTQRIEAALRLQATLLEQLAGAKPVPELRVGLVEVRQGLLQVRGQVRELTDQLNDLLDLAPGTVLELVDPVPPVPPVQSAEEAAQLALAYSPEIREAEQTIAKAEAALQIARMDYLPDVNVIGGFANQTSADYIQPDVGYLGLTASYTFWDWRKRRDVNRQRQTQIALAHQNLHVTRDKVHLEARKAYGAFEQALEAYRLAAEMVQARQEAEKGAAGPAAVAAAKGATAKAALEALKAEINFRVAHAQLMQAIGKE